MSRRFYLYKIDDLNLRRELGDWTAPLSVAAMAFLAALAIALWSGASSVAEQWETGPGSTFVIQVPQPGEPGAALPGTRLGAVQAVLSATPATEISDTLPEKQLKSLLRPWLGDGDSVVPLPAVIALRTSDPGLMAGLAAELARDAPGTTVEANEAWLGRFGPLASSLKLCANVLLWIVAAITVLVVSLVTRGRLSSRRDTIWLLSQLGAPEGYIAGRFARIAALLALAGGAIGGVAAIPVIAAMTKMAAPLTGGAALSPLPEEPVFHLAPLFLSAAMLSVVAALIGYLTAQVVTRVWLRRFP